MATVISIVNQKGGTGKTITSIGLAYFLRKKYSRVLIIDCNPNAVASNYLHPDKLFTHGLYDCITENNLFISNFIVNTSLHGVDLLPADKNLLGLEIELLTKNNREKVFSSKLKNIIADYEMVIIDTPSSLGLITLNALTMSNYVTIPVISNNYNDTDIMQLMKTIKMVQLELNPLLKLSGILIQLVGAPTNSKKDTLGSLKTKFLDMLYESVIFLPDNNYLESGFFTSRFKKNNRTVASYGSFCDEFLEKVKA